MPIATEELPFVEVKARLDRTKIFASILSARLDAIPRPNCGRRLLELGAAAGGLTIAFEELGYSAVGVEPHEAALSNAQKLADSLRIPCPVVRGRAESLPFPAGSFDLVIANSVLEHVIDIDACFREVARVLSPGGVFWFETASTMCPRQCEIRAFPLFGWYPNSLKVRIMNWAVEHRPNLIGHTQAPAIHWFNDNRAQQHFRAVGFGKVWDRWDVRNPNQGGKLHALGIQTIRRFRAVRRLANTIVPCCAYAAIKEI
jgi:SAM-dependent methyltransferase